jgi:hypothetical protein
MRRSLVRLVMVLIAVNAAIAVFVLLSGDIGDTEGKILITSLLATGTAVVGMVLAPALTARRLGPVPAIGLAAAVIGFGLVTVGLWAEIDLVGFGRTMGSVYLIAVAAALACLLSGWPITGRGAWVGIAAYTLVALVAGSLLAAIWFEIDSSGFWRGFAVLAVLLAAASLATPILHRAARPAGREPYSHCPFCGSGVAGSSGAEITCSSCGRRYRVTLS